MLVHLQFCATVDVRGELNPNSKPWLQVILKFNASPQGEKSGNFFFFFSFWSAFNLFWSFLF